MDKIAVLIPCYNESKTIEKCVLDWKKELPESTIYVYDNNSTDGTGDIAKRVGAIVKHEYRQGKGHVIRRMFREIDAECYIIIDGDDTYPAEYGKAMSELVLNKKADMVIGDRLSSTYYKENKRLFHAFGNNLVRKCVNTLFKSDLKDIMTGYRAFSYQFAKTFPALSSGFEIETEMTMHALDKKMYIENLVIDYRDRPDGSISKLNTYSDGFKVLKTIMQLCRIYKPFVFYGSISLLLALVAIGFFIPILITYINTGLVPRYPTLIICGFTMIAAIQSLFVGLQLENISFKNRQEFEIELIKRQDTFNELLK